MDLHRRNFLRGGLAWGLLGSGFLQTLLRQAAAQGTTADKKMIFIFQRGGNDGLNTIVPRGDSRDYSPATRPTLYLPPNPATDLGNGFAELHPAMEPIMEIFNNLGGAGSPGSPGNLAVIHRAGYAKQSRSHFDSQDYWERGAIGSPSDTGVTNGMIYRHILETTDLSDPENGFAAASISGDSLISLTGNVPFPNFTDAGDFDFLGDAAQRAKFLGRAADPGASPPAAGRGILGLYGGTPFLGKPVAGTVHATGTALGATIGELKAASEGGYLPENGAVYPGGSFGNRLQQAAMLLKRTSARIIGINIGGHDTHTSQGGATGTQANNLGDLAAGFQALYRDLEDLWPNLVVVTATEFGRTSRENGSNGTDHAEASAVFVAGGGVKGGVYNCDETTWTDRPMFQVNDRYLSHRTDFRGLFAEIFAGHFGDTEDQLNAIIPGYQDLKTLETMQPLGLFA